MSHSNLIHEAGARVGEATLGDNGSTPGVDFTSEMKEALVTRAKDIIAGRTQPSALIAPPEVEQLLRREFGEREPQPTAEALRQIAERHCLEVHYGGKPVACFTTQTGTLAVLASGEREVEALLQGLSDEEGAQVVVTDSEQG